MGESGKRLIEAAKEAVAIAKGEQPADRMWFNGHAYVPESRLKEMQEALEAAREVIDTVAGDNRPAREWATTVRDRIDAILEVRPCPASV